LLQSRDFQEGDCARVAFVGGLRMDTRSVLQGIVAYLYGLGMWCLPVIAQPVYTYRGDLNLKIPTELDASDGCRANAEERQVRKVVLICKKTSI